MGSVVEGENKIFLGQIDRAEVLMDIGSGSIEHAIIESADCKEDGCTVVFQNGSQGDLMGEGKLMEPFLKSATGQEATLIKAKFGTNIFSLSMDRMQDIPAAAD